MAGDASAVLQIAVLGTSLRNAFSAEPFERVALAGHRHPRVAKACSGNGQFAALAIFGVGFDTGAAAGDAAVDRHQRESGRAVAPSACDGAPVADYIVAGLADRRDRGEAIPACGIQTGVGWTHAL